MRDDDGSMEEFARITTPFVKNKTKGEIKEKEENPITLQEYINKKYEVRYTVVGNQHLACKIDSQMSQRANIDWRRYDLKNTPHYAIDIPSEIVSVVILLSNIAPTTPGAL